MTTPLQIKLSEVEVLTALKKALDQNYVDNLRERHPNVALDSKLRGFIGEKAFQKWAAQHQIFFQKTNCQETSTGMDIDFVYSKNKKELKVELKTSLIPDADQDLESVINNRDIKLIRRKNKSIEEIESDLHVQIIYKQLRLRKDDWLKNQPLALNENIDSIYRKLAAYRYKTDCYLAGWIDKESLIQLVNSKPHFLKTWKYGFREFWCCNLAKDAKDPEDLIHYFSNFGE